MVLGTCNMNRSWERIVATPSHDIKYFRIMIQKQQRRRNYLKTCHLALKNIKF